MDVDRAIAIGRDGAESSPDVDVAWSQAHASRVLAREVDRLRTLVATPLCPGCRQPIGDDGPHWRVRGGPWWHYRCTDEAPPVTAVELLHEALDASTTDDRCDEEWVRTLAARVIASARTPAEEHLHELLYQAWGVIANAGMKVGWGWDSEHPEWVAAAERWRDTWHATLPSPIPARARTVEQIAASQQRANAEADAGLAAALGAGTAAPDGERLRAAIDHLETSEAIRGADDALRVVFAEMDRLRALAARSPQPAGRCGAEPPRAGKRLADITSCTLPARHTGWHHDQNSRAEWGRAWVDGDGAAAEPGGEPT